MTTYYSIATGIWESNSSWSTTGHGGAAAGAFPGFGDTANISNGHTITVTSDLTTGGSTAIIVQTDTSTNSNNTGTLSFSPTNTTKINLQIGQSFVSGGKLTILAGSKFAPIQRGQTCTISLNNTTANPDNSLQPNSTGTLVFEAWGQHRENATSDIYVDTLSSAAASGQAILAVNGNFSPSVVANDYLWIVEQESSPSGVVKAELAQIQSVSGNNITLTANLRYAYTTTNCLIFKANKYWVNTVLSSDNTSGTNTLVFADNIYPSGTPGGSVLITDCNSSATSGNFYSHTEYLSASSYNSGTQTLTLGSNTSQNHAKGSVVIVDDFNVTVTGSGSGVFATDSQFAGTGTCSSWRLCLAKFDTFPAGGGNINGMVLYQSNLINVATLNGNGSSSSYPHVYAYGLGTGFKASGFTLDASTNNPFFIGNTTAKGASFIRSYLTWNAASGGSGTADSIMFLNPNFIYCQDCVFHSSACGILSAPISSQFINCDIGQAQLNVDGGIFQPQGCMFYNCNIYGSGAGTSLAPAIMLLKGTINSWNNITLGQNKQGKVINNLGLFEAPQGYGSIVINGLTLASGEPTDLTYGLNPFPTKQTHEYGFPYFKIQSYGGNAQSIKLIFPSGYIVSDTTGSDINTTGPSVQFNHKNSNQGMWFDVPVYLTAAAHTITCYTKTSTATWIEAPRMMLIDATDVGQYGASAIDFKSVASAVQGTLTAGSFFSFTLNYTPSTADIYILRLYAKNGSGTVVFDDVTVS